MQVVAVKQPSLWQVIISEPLSLVAAQPHQALISTASVALMAQFAASGGILHPLVGFILAIGVEWAYLRGLASDSKATTVWGALLNWSAAGIVVLWGSLWCLKAFGVISEQPEPWLAVLMALAHVVPIAWLSLCSAMTHRAAMQLTEQRETERRNEDRQREQAQIDKQNDLQLEVQREQAKLAAWKDAQQFKAQLKQAESASTQNARAPLASQEDAPPKIYQCASCGSVLTMKQYAAAKRWGRCGQCKSA